VAELNPAAGRVIIARRLPKGKSGAAKFSFQVLMQSEAS
jgi:hypothetical protein